MANGDGGGDGDELAGQARALLRGQCQGVLSTISVHRPGYPYGSLTPYALSLSGAPLILISTLAAHTQNLLADARASLFIAEPGAAGSPDLSDDPQASGRIALLGRFAPVPAATEADARARYAARLPRAAANSQSRDFQYWEMTVEEVRLIAGFGRMAWMAGATVLGDPDATLP
jgi:putative heme iron utilization protein